MITKLSLLKAAAAQDNWREALRIAAKFPALGEQKKPIMQAWEATVRPEFQLQLGRDPQNLIAVGIAALKQKYGV